MTDDFRDLLFEFNHAGVRYVVVGAHALGVHGVPRATVDLDVWIEPTRENAQRVWNALAAFGAPLDSLELRLDDFIRPDTVVQLGLPPLRIDILTSASGVTFDEAWADHVEAPFGDLTVHFMGRETLTRNKRATGRMKDLGDLESLGAP